jgi:hypothetical protein
MTFYAGWEGLRCEVEIGGVCELFYGGLGCQRLCAHACKH